jgi:hypothetical protein
MNDNFELTPRAKAWIDGIRGQFAGQALQDPAIEEAAVSHAIGGSNFKIL